MQGSNDFSKHIISSQNIPLERPRLDAFRRHT